MSQLNFHKQPLHERGTHEQPANNRLPSHPNNNRQRLSRTGNHHYPRLLEPQHAINRAISSRPNLRVDVASGSLSRRKNRAAHCSARKVRAERTARSEALSGNVSMACSINIGQKIGCHSNERTPRHEKPPGQPAIHN